MNEHAGSGVAGSIGGIVDDQAALVERHPPHFLAGHSFADAGSPHYGAIVSRAVAGKAVAGEEMWRVALYKRGLVVDYPPNRAGNAGSCVFIHIWRSPASGTAGCVALAEAGVKELQTWAKLGTAVIGILPKAAFDRFAACLPGVLAPR